jgi:serine/threonine protein kinase/Tol biopolymer transport system component
MQKVEGSHWLAHFADFELDLRSGELRQKDGKVVRLSEQPFRILLSLLDHPGEVVPREEIRKKLWPNDTVVEFEHSISAAMSRLRQALRDAGEEPRYIETLARRGYRWMVPVEWVETSPTVARSPLISEATNPCVSENLIGKKVSHYRILEVLGGGGMGVVYKAEDLRLGRSVAIKFLGEEFTGDPRALERFEREARAISALDHPNICTIYEVEEHEGRPFIVMQLLQGQTLRQRIESSRSEQAAFSRRELLEIAIATAQGLDAAHQKDIIHRDIKPANIFMTVRGEIKLLDFGLAKLVGTEGLPSESPTLHEPERDRPIYASALNPSKASLTLTGATMGTASYMSPEQVRGEPLDQRTDLFSFGAVLYEMATGCQPFRGETTEAIHDAILNSTPPLPLLQNPDLPAQLQSIITRALEKDPGARYQSASEIISDLERLRLAESGLATGTKGGPAHGIVHPWMRTGVIGTAAVLLFVVAGFVSRKYMLRTHALGVENMELTRLTDSGKAESVAVSPDGRYAVYSQREPGGVGLRVRQIATNADIQILPAEAIGFEGLSFSPDGNYVYFVRPDSDDPGFKYLYVVPALGGTARLLVKDIDSPIGFSPDGRRFVYTRGIPKQNATEIRIADADGGSNHLLATMTDTFAGFQPGATWSPDGQTIAVPLMRFRKRPAFVLYTIRVMDGTASEFLTSSSSIGRALWPPEGNTLLLVLGDSKDRGQVWAVSYPEKQPRRITNDLSDYYRRTDLTRDGDTLAAIEGRLISNLWVASDADPSEAQQITTLNMPLYSVMEAPDGRLLAIASGKLWAFTPDGKQREQFTGLDNADIATVCGHFVILNLYQSGATEIMRFDADGSNPAKLASGDIMVPVCSPDGKYLFYVEAGPPQKIWRISVEGGTPLEVARVLGENVVGRMAISPDGEKLAYPFEEYTPAPRTKLAVIPIAGGSPIEILDAPGGVYTEGSLLWSPDGRSLEYILTRNGSSNIWEQPIHGRPPRQLTTFSSGRIFDFDWSHDRKRLLLARGEVSSDVVLLSHLH